MIIDFHTHCYPDRIAARAIENVGILGLNASFDGTLSGLKKSMSDCGIDISLNLPLVNSPETTRGVNAWAAKNNSFPVYSLGSVHPLDPDPTATIEWLKSLGLRGIKMHPEYQQFSFDDSTLEPIWKACIEHDMFMLTHAGEDIGFEPPPKSNPQSLANFHHRFPELTLVLAHLGSWGLWQEVEKHLIGLPIYLDLAFVLGMLDDTKLVEIIRAHGSEKVLFGTDTPWRGQHETLEKFNNLQLTKQESDNILYNNAAVLLGLADNLVCSGK